LFVINFYLGVWRNSSAYWKGNAQNDTLQRVYGMSFPVPKEYKAWEIEQEAAKERDHRLQGKVEIEIELFIIRENVVRRE
jgi:threonyl-tRNA synthetase